MIIFVMRLLWVLSVGRSVGRRPCTFRTNPSPLDNSFTGIAGADWLKCRLRPLPGSGSELSSWWTFYVLLLFSVGLFPPEDNHRDEFISTLHIVLISAWAGTYSFTYYPRKGVTRHFSSQTVLDITSPPTFLHRPAAVKPIKLPIYSFLRRLIFFSKSAKISCADFENISKHFQREFWKVFLWNSEKLKLKFRIIFRELPQNFQQSFRWFFHGFSEKFPWELRRLINEISYGYRQASKSVYFVRYH